MEVRSIVKYLALAFVAWFVFSNAWPAYSGAYKVRKAMIDVAAQSANADLRRAEVIDKAFERIRTTGVPGIEKADISATKDGKGWVVTANYELKRPLYGTTTLVYSFDVATDRKLPWVREESPSF